MYKIWRILALCMCITAVTVCVAFAAGNIGEAKAKAIAIQHARVNQADIKLLRVKVDTEDGKPVYDVKFHTRDTAYEYEIDAASGKILKHATEARNASANAAAGVITPAQAKKTALARVAGATEANIVEFELDHDDGRQQYEGKIVFKGIKYEFEIDAISGKITSWEEDRN